MSYRSFFGLSAEPFRADLALEQVLTTPELLGVQQRLDYVLRLGCSTALPSHWLPALLPEVICRRSPGRRSGPSSHHCRNKKLTLYRTGGNFIGIRRAL
jgi:hypothetical protein